MELHDLHPTIGSLVGGVALDPVTGNDPRWSSDDVDHLRRLMDERHLLRIPGRPIDGEAQIGFVARFGPIVPERRLWGYVSNSHPEGVVREGPLEFHSDFAFTAHPIEMISLHALEVPSDRSPTIYADAVAAVDRIPPALRSQLEGLGVLNCFDLLQEGDHRMRLAEIDPRSPRHIHPVIDIHPRTGEAVIMANALHSDSLIGVDAEESEQLLTALFDVLYDDDHLFELDWEIGDLVLWDNIALHHARREVTSESPRTLQRVTVGSYTPSEAIPNLGELLAEKHG